MKAGSINNGIAWVKFNTDGTIIGSDRVSGVVKNGTGDYTISFINVFEDVNYLAMSTPIDSSSDLIAGRIHSQTTSSTRIQFTGGSAVILGLLVALSVPKDPNIGAMFYAMGN